LTQVDLGGIANVGERFVVEMEQAKPTLAIAKVIAVLEALGLSLQASHRLDGEAGSTSSMQGAILAVRQFAAGPDDGFVSRSQARTVMRDARVAGPVVLDFEGVETIGQAFADEIFRVFANAHPRAELDAVNASEEVQRTIRRARAGRHEPSG